MTQTPAGWYADPDPSYAGSGRIRYWDGQQWTEHVHEPAPPVPYGQYPPYGQHSQYPQYPPAQYPAPQPVATTPDGQPLAGWWQRVFAIWLDGLILLPLNAVFLVPFFVNQWDELTSWFEELDVASQNDSTMPVLPDILDPTSSEVLLLGLSSVVIALVYNLVFLRWKQATPGKLILGLRVRRRDTPGALPWSTILLRVGAVTGISVLTNIPWIGYLFLPLALLNVLWPLWDDKKQALHDKVAGTNVVRVR